MRLKFGGMDRRALLGVRACGNRRPCLRLSAFCRRALPPDRAAFGYADRHSTQCNEIFDGAAKPIPGPHLVYGFLTTEPNAIVEPIHPKAMPVILTTDEERDV